MDGVHDMGGLADFGPVRVEPGEPVFHDEWERRAFALAVDLAQQGRFAWPQFQANLIEAVRAAEADDPLHPSRGYYESWLAALQATLADTRLLG